LLIFQMSILLFACCRCAKDQQPVVLDSVPVRHIGGCTRLRSGGQQSSDHVARVLQLHARCEPWDGRSMGAGSYLALCPSFSVNAMQKRNADLIAD
jgi:hypothetical protein